jgi:uncharacterized membrane protein YccC
VVSEARRQARDRLQQFAGWWARHDSGLRNTKRAARAALLIPLIFALTLALFDNAQTPLFAVFGAFAFLLLVDFTGSPPSRLRAYAGLFVVGAGFIALGTVLSSHPVLAPLSMGVIAFAVLFVGIVSPSAAKASTAALLLYVLPVSVAGPPSVTGDRLLGYAFAGVLCTVACMVLWPPPWHNELRLRLCSTARALARLVDAHARGRRDNAAYKTATEELAALRQRFEASPFPPTGAAPGDASLARLVGQMEWVGHNAVLTPDRPTAFGLADVDALHGSVSTTLDALADVVSDAEGHPPADPVTTVHLRTEVNALEDTHQASLSAAITRAINQEVARPTGGPATGGATNGSADTGGEGLLSLVDPSFRARALAVATSEAGETALDGAGAGSAMRGAMRYRETARNLREHCSLASAWFRNSLRGAVALALAVGLVEVTEVEHGFWVILGTLSVLRSNALGTGASALRAVGGTVVGFVVGSAIMLGPGEHRAVLWVLLPFVVFVAGVAPLTISFAAGQAAFTVMVVIIFNIIDPQGWSVGLVRIEDVTIGCAVSVLVGLLFWPRGATAQLGRALTAAYATASAYLTVAAQRMVTVGGQPDMTSERVRADVAYVRLDDAFRQFVGERGDKAVPVSTVSTLFTGAIRLRMAAHSLEIFPPIDLPPGDHDLTAVTRAAHRLHDAFEDAHRWFRQVDAVLTGRSSDVEAPRPHGADVHGDLVVAYEAGREQRRPDQVRSTLRMLWADELLDEMGAIQGELARHASEFSAHPAARWM